MIAELDNSILENRKGFINVEKTVAPAVLIFLSIFKLGVCAIIFSAVVRFCSGDITPYKAVMLIVSSFIVFAGFEMAGSMQNIRGVAVQNLDEIAKLRELPTISEGTITEIGTAEICLNNVHFSYVEKPLFENINVFIPEGKTTAIVGGSGSGKTTLCNLIARFWDIQKGTITIGNKDIKSINPENLMQKMSFVFQDVTLFNDTIFNNIQMGNPNATKEQVFAAAKAAYCDEFVRNMPDGYNTLLGENGSTLSGGERQRISIARALLKDSPIILLDEATASLDPENEVFVQKAIAKLVENKTVIIIAHRLRTVADADQILVLDNGKLVESGTHSELMKKNGLYYKLYHIQQERVGWTV